MQEEKNGTKAAAAKEVKLYAQIPSIEKMDASLSTLAACEKLSLSTNQIEKIANLNGLSKSPIMYISILYLCECRFEIERTKIFSSLVWAFG